MTTATWGYYIVWLSYLLDTYTGGIVLNDRLDGPALRLSPLMAAARGYERRN